MASKGKHKYRTQWLAFAEYLKKNERPAEFEQAYSVVADKVSGLYRSEAQAMWNNIRAINPRTMVEVGRNLGGSQFLFCCAALEVEKFLSIDIEAFDLTDWALRDWGNARGIRIQNCVHDSTTWKPHMVHDFVFIDGGHTGEIVKADIEVWKDHAQFIAFHDYADQNGKNKHRRHYPDVVAEITAAADRYGWLQFGERGRSDITYRIPSK